MKYKLFFYLTLCLSTAAFSQSYVPTDEGSKIHFVIKNFGINTGGDFNGLKGIINFSPDNLAESDFNVSVAANTIDTDNNLRDKSLKSSEYFNADKYPEIRLTSTKISKTNKTAAGFYFFSGNIIMHGVTRPVSFPFHADKLKDGYLFTGEFELERTDFGIGDRSAVLSNKVIVTLKVFAKKK